MKESLPSLASWLFIAAIIAVASPAPWHLSAGLAIGASLLWLLSQPQSTDYIGLAIGGILTVAFLIPLPLTSSLSTPMRLVVLVGGWAITASVIGSAIASQTGKQSRKE